MGTTESARARPEGSVEGLSFSGAHLDARRARGARDYPVEGLAVVVNVGVTEARVVNTLVRSEAETTTMGLPLPPWKSVALRDGVVESAESLVVLRVRDVRNIGNMVREQGWKLYGDTVPQGSPFPRDTPLYISSQDTLGTVEVDPAVFAGQGGSPGGKRPLTLKVNLWYAPPHTDCFIHTLHPFLEVHTQVHGTGHMQKFREQDERTLYEDVIMSAGLTHAPFFGVGAKGELLYPWHRYYADTDCIWMAIELHFPGA